MTGYSEAQKWVIKNVNDACYIKRKLSMHGKTKKNHILKNGYVKFLFGKVMSYSFDKLAPVVNGLFPDSAKAYASGVKFMSHEMGKEIQHQIHQMKSFTDSKLLTQLQQLRKTNTFETMNSLSRNAFFPATLYGAVMSEKIDSIRRFESIAHSHTYFKVPVHVSEFIREQKNIEIIFRKSTCSLKTFKKLQQTFPPMHQYTFSEIFTTHVASVSRILKQQYGVQEMSENISMLLQKRYGLVINDSNDFNFSTEGIVNHTLSGEFFEPPSNNVFENPEIQKWFNGLASNAKSIFYNIIVRWFLLSIIVGIGNDLVKEAIKCHLPFLYGSECSTREARKQIQNVVSAQDLWGNLKNFRLVSGDNVYLRTAPAENAAVLEMLSRNTLVLVVNKSNRQWIEVETVYGDETIRGWVSRRYTLPIHQH
ncbi:SH3 domain-containing protein [Enterobacter hormaechei]|nr:SH3 domain-containing protein [Enterobacter hormaechei]